MKMQVSPNWCPLHGVPLRAVRTLFKATFVFGLAMVMFLAISVGRGSVFVAEAASNSTVFITPQDAVRSYGAANPAFTASYSGLISGPDASVLNGPLVCTSTATPTSQAGTYPITCSGLSSSQYKLIYNVGTLTVTKVPLTVTADNTIKTYGQPNPPFSVAYAGFVLGQNSSVLTGTLAYTTVATTASVVAAYPVTPSGLDSLNYTITNMPGTLTVAKAHLSVAANNATKVYGSPNPGFTGHYNGFVLGEGPGDLGGTLLFATPAVDASPVGVYPITTSGLSSDNYQITYDEFDAVNTPGSLTVTKAPLIVTADNKTKMYGTVNPALTSTISGFVLGHNSSVLGGTLGHATGATTASAVGGYAVTPSGFTSGNYSFTYMPGTLTVTKAPLLVWADNKNKTFGTANPAFTGGISGLQNGDNITPSYASTALLASAVGTYPITVTLSDPGTKLGNYSLTNTPGTLTITDLPAVRKVPLTVTVDNKTRSYGSANPAFTGSIIGLQDGDNITVSYASPATIASGVGGYAITATLSDPDSKLGNYVVTNTPGTLTVTTVPLMAWADDKNKTFGTANPAFTGGISGLQNGDSITPSYASTALLASAVGTYPITVTLSDPDNKLGNYSLTNTPGTLTITDLSALPKVPLTVTVDNKTRSYGSANPAFTASIVGLQNGDNITVSFASPATIASVVGGYAITATLSDPDSKLGNYVVTNTPGTLTVTKVPLTVTVDNKTRSYGLANPAFTGSISGVQNGDNITASYASPATIASVVGGYAITATLSDLDSKLGNYSVTNTPGALVVTKVPLIVWADDKTKTLGTANPAFTGGIAGLQNGDNITTSYASTAVLASVVGAYPITVTLSDPGSKVGNYSLTNTPGTLTITASLVNHPPVAVDDAAQTPPSTPVTVTVLGNDSDPDNDPLTVTQATSIDGTTIINGDGTVTFTPAVGVTGTATINYVISDGKGGTASAKVVVTIPASNGGGGTVPAAITGIVTDRTTGLPVPGAKVEVSEDFNGDGIPDFTASTTTDQDGRYVIAVPRGNWEYTPIVSAPVQVGNQTITVRSVQKTQVGAVETLTQNVPGSKMVSGQLFATSPADGTVVTPAQLFGNAKAAGILRPASGGGAERPFTIAPDGTFAVDAVPIGQYTLVFQVELPDTTRLAGVTMPVTVGQNGEINLILGLIDPHGTVTDAVTKKVIAGANMQLFWADTPLNRSHGRVPHTQVQLPELPNFPPSQNHAPQLTSAAGEYAWMVWADGDYYIFAGAVGYDTYDSRVEGRTVPVKPGEDSYIMNGIIHVGQSIVNYDLEMQPLVIHGAYVKGYPDKTFRPEGLITRAEIAAIFARLSAPKKPSAFGLGFGDVADDHWANEYTRLVKQLGLMAGDQQGQFRPQAPITRGEMAQIVQRFGHLTVTGPTPWDAVGHWAEQAVAKTVASGLMVGYPDGTFRPNQNLTRAEAVTSINRLVGRKPLKADRTQSWPDAPVSHWAFAQIEEASRGHQFTRNPDDTENFLTPLDLPTW